MKNPFLYSNDNKRYHTWNYYLRTTFHQKVFKVPLNAALGCPNRDGTCGVGGCTFCSSSGSGEQIQAAQEPLAEQFVANLNVMRRKWPKGKAMAYFQAYTNTYCSLAELKKMIAPFYESEDVVGICIATRADCLEAEKIAYLQDLAKTKEIWVELGLQSIHDKTALSINRGHTFSLFQECVARLANTNIKICVHLMNGLPYESKEMMIESAKTIGALPVHALKIHMLYLSRGTQMEKQYQEASFPLLEKSQYIDIVIQQLEQLPPEMIIQRLTGDGDAATQVASLWTLNKTSVLNEIDKEMVRRNTYQGKNYRPKA